MLDILVQDREGLTGPVKNVPIQVPTEDKITVRDLIVTRVRAELSDGNHDVAVSAASRLDQRSAEQHAIRSFTENGLFVIVDDMQLTELDQLVDLHAESLVEFLRIIPLKGG
ncbi:hypothetical protein [Yoonia maritima]|uniref:hypothetical protein n=1 Tax=Yoonia maritima TaxID=1435347 RepID=UPI0037363554